MTSKSIIKIKCQVINKKTIWNLHIHEHMYLVCDIFLLHKYNYVCKRSVIVSLFDHILCTTTLHKNVTPAVCKSYFVLVWFTQFGLVGLDWIWIDELWKPVLLSTWVSVSLNFIRLEATSKIFSTDACLTLDLDIFQLSWM